MAKSQAGVVVCAVVLCILAVGAAAAGARGAAPSRPAEHGAPHISGHTDGRKTTMTAVHKGLGVRKMSDRTDRTIRIEFRFEADAVTLALDSDGVVTVERLGRAARIESAESMARVQDVLSGSIAVFAARALLAERESRSDLKAGEYSLLTSAAFLASLVGDTDAPARLASRFVEKHRGIVRPVTENCWGEYSKETTNAWNDLQNCMSEANQDESYLWGAYRRVACNAVWILRSESSWFEYLNCLSPLSISK